MNAKGGIEIDGKKRKVKLVLLDDKTDPNVTVNNVSKLITEKHVDALMGSCTDSSRRAGRPRRGPQQGADGHQLRGDQHVRIAPQKWTYAWDLFFNSEDLTETPFNTVDELGLTDQQEGRHHPLERSATRP